LNDIISRRRSDIDGILEQYGVPRADLQPAASSQ